jgi:predicted MFS family arabinose efflux permease
MPLRRSVRLVTVPAFRWQLQNPLGPLRHVNFRLLWTGELLRQSAQWMDVVTRGFLVLSLTGSAAQLALVNAVRGAPLLVLGLLSGVLADRVSRKRLLMASQTTNVVANVAVGVLALTGHVQLWHVYVTAALIGMSTAVNTPARQSMLPSLVPPKDLQGAVVLNTSTLNLGQALGPIVGGAAVSLVGVGGSYLVQAGIFAVAGSLIKRLVLPERAPSVKQRWRDSAADGVRYLRRHPVLPALLAVSVVPMLLVQPFRGVVPAIAAYDLHADARLTGLLLAALGAGSVVSFVVLATLPTMPRPGRRIVVQTVAFSVAIAVFAVSPSYLTAASALFVGGWLQSSTRTLTQSLQLDDTEEGYQGRISSVWVVNRGMMPIGSLVLAGLTTVVSASTSVAAMSAAGAAITLLVAWRAPALWRR